jgi:hypothetical protein
MQNLTSVQVRSSYKRNSELCGSIRCGKLLDRHEGMACVGTAKSYAVKQYLYAPTGQAVGLLYQYIYPVKLRQYNMDTVCKLYSNI